MARTSDIVKELKEYTFVPSSKRLTGIKEEYGVYHVEQKEKTNIINPFDRRAINY
ncbi:MAG: hypothetical protein M3261_05430 [Thermoproteota archaeon]|nr:hypothetical protein [Thermoproteota archaeon]